MSLPRPPMKLIHHRSDGKTVCFDHRLRRCDNCCMDFTFGESDEDDFDPYFVNDREDSDEPLPEDNGEEEEGDGSNEEGDRVFVLGGGMARFMPQWDAQVLGPANTFRIQKDYNNPPKPLPLSSLQTYHCSTCQLTWLIGEVGDAAARSHPSHHSYSHEYAGTSRSLIVFTDGACSGNGTSDARGGLGIFFGPGSRFNLAERIANPATSQKAELAAVARAMEKVRSQILPQRRVLVAATQGGHGPRAVSDVIHMRLIVVTDSSYIVEGMCRHFSNWKENKDGIIVNNAGKAVENSAGFLRLKNEVEKLSMVGVQVCYYLVAREENMEADMLAKGSISL